VPETPGDINGDRRADIKDVQQLLSDTLADAATPAAADVNGDGAVDVRDLQCLLAGVVETEELPERPAQDQNDDATTPATAKPNPPQSGAVERARLLRQPAPGETQHTFRFDDGPLPRPGTARYLYALTPHAPPFSTCS
jgi:hypothetical protein